MNGWCAASRNGCLRVHSTRTGAVAGAIISSVAGDVAEAGSGSGGGGWLVDPEAAAAAVAAALLVAVTSPADARCGMFVAVIKRSGCHTEGAAEWSGVEWSGTGRERSLGGDAAQWLVAERRPLSLPTNRGENRRTSHQQRATAKRGAGRAWSTRDSSSSSSSSSGGEGRPDTHVQAPDERHRATDLDLQLHLEAAETQRAASARSRREA